MHVNLITKLKIESYPQSIDQNLWDTSEGCGRQNSNMAPKIPTPLGTYPV